MSEIEGRKTHIMATLDSNGAVAIEYVQRQHVAYTRNEAALGGGKSVLHELARIVSGATNDGSASF